MSTNTSKGTIQSSGSPESHFKLKVTVLGLYHLIMIAVLVYCLFKIWPNYTVGEDGVVVAKNIFRIFGEVIVAGSESGLLLLVVIAAALGSYIHASTSFVSYVGNKSLVMSWAWWYILRPFIGVALALVFYFVIRGGLLAGSSNAKDVSVFGITAIAGLVGMFSKQATDKLNEVFNNLFSTKSGEGDDSRKDKLGEKVSVIDKMIPRNKISSFIIEEGTQLSDIKIEELYDLLNDTVTRIPILDGNNRLKYVIHQSIIFKFIFEESLLASENGKSFEAKNLTLEGLLNYEEYKNLIFDAVAFVGKDSTILTAKETMEEIKNCQDVFITENGSRDEEVLGWLTNVDITKCLAG